MGICNCFFLLSGKNKTEKVSEEKRSIKIQSLGKEQIKDKAIIPFQKISEAIRCVLSKYYHLEKNGPRKRAIKLITVRTCFSTTLDPM